jgi:ATP-binding cassette subfamily F protein 3
VLSAATDEWMLVADGTVRAFDGDLDDYKEWVGARTSSRQRRATADERPAANRREERRTEALARQRESQARKPFEKRLREIEAELAELTRESQEIERWLASGDAYSEGERERLQATLRRRGEAAARIAALEDDWLWAHAEMESEVNRVRE